MGEREYLPKLRADLLAQFRSKPNIDALLSVMANQLLNLFEFFDNLNLLRTLKTAVGVQLDGIGDIVCLSRIEALIISRQAGIDVPMDDDTYRLYLIWKIHLNTSHCTHKDVYTALTMFWDKTPLYYHEELEHPATIFLSPPEFKTNRDDPYVIDTTPLALAPKVKAAGVALKIITKMEHELPPINLTVGGTFATINQTSLHFFTPTVKKTLTAKTWNVSIMTTTPPTLPS